MLAPALLAPCFGARAAELPPNLTQAEAQELAGRVNSAGSDRSLQSSTTKAMQALIQFNDSDIPGAVKSAIRAYGSFKTSEDLDRARKINILKKAGLGSSGTLTVSEEDGAFLASRTSFRRLDPQFLEKGEAAKIAEEFEKKTGIKRKDFLEQMANASEAKLFVNDPKLFEKAQADFNAFVEKIPNAEFKAKVKSAVGLIPDLTKNQLLATAVQKAVALAAKTMPSDSDLALVEKAQIAVGPPNPAAAPPANRELAAVAPATKAESPGEVVAAAPASVKEGEKEDAKDDAIGSLTSDQMARTYGRETGNPLLAGVVRAAMGEAKDDDTIFRIVSKKYREVTPRLRYSPLPFVSQLRSLIARLPTIRQRARDPNAYAKQKVMGGLFPAVRVLALRRHVLGLGQIGLHAGAGAAAELVAPELALGLLRDLRGDFFLHLSDAGGERGGSALLASVLGGVEAFTEVGFLGAEDVGQAGLEALDELGLAHGHHDRNGSRLARSGGRIVGHGGGGE